MHSFPEFRRKAYPPLELQDFTDMMPDDGDPPQPRPQKKQPVIPQNWDEASVSTAKLVRHAYDDLDMSWAELANGLSEPDRIVTENFLTNASRYLARPSPRFRRRLLSFCSLMDVRGLSEFLLENESLPAPSERIEPAALTRGGAQGSNDTSGAAMLPAADLRLLQFPIQIPYQSPSTLVGDDFMKVFRGTYFLFRRSVRHDASVPPILISRVEINAEIPFNYVEVREGKGRTTDLRQEGLAYLAQGSLIFMAVDKSGHPSLASFSQVTLPLDRHRTPVLDGYILTSTFDPPKNFNFVVRATLVHAIDTNAATGVFDQYDRAYEEFRKHRPSKWEDIQWAQLFAERFDPSKFVRLNGNYFENFETHHVEF